MQNNESEGYPLDQSPLYCLQSKKKLASILYVSTVELSRLLSKDKLYQELDINKGSKPRRIEKPAHKLKQLQKRIATLLQRIKLPSYIYAIRRGASYITNAQQHRGSSIVRSLDIESYFVSTLKKQVYYFFNTKMKCSPDVAHSLTEISIFKNYLPTGSPLSPILSFYTHMGIWDEIYNLVSFNNCTLTIYIDDLTISGDTVSDKLIWQIKQKLYSAGLRSNHKKEKYYNGKVFCEVTGVIILPNGVLKAPNRQHLKIYNLRKLIRESKSEDATLKLRQKLDGLESQLQQIDKIDLLVMGR
jgi:retron-type reverse transcriptase